MDKRAYLRLLFDTCDRGEFPARSINGSTCRYRAHDGRRCAVGVLIPDDVYSPVIEEHSVTSMSDPTDMSPQHIARGEQVQAAVLAAVEGMTLADFDKVQNCHDSRQRVWDDDEKTRFKLSLLKLDCFQEFAADPEFRVDQ